MAVRLERSGSVTTVVLSRPEVRNAVDGPTAEALVAAFRAFEADESALAAVLWGEGGTFCAGADLKAISDGRGNRVAPPGGARAAAEELAAEIARFPQACMRGDRLSVYEQGDLEFEAAIGNELRHGLESLRSPEALAGARRFASGSGRHGEF